jgi:2-polyprenyl-3-methyl-5-hydroxy-6-metoxy-1,4-benzoquinol methylase
MAFLSLAQRRLQPELMDQPGLAPSEHAQALAGLRRLNVASRTSRQLWQAIATHACIEPNKPLRLLDVASGGGDIALGLWRLAKRRGVDLRVLGLDVSPTACAQAARHCQPAGKAITFQCTDVTTASWPKGFDVATSSLFLHHLPWNLAATVLRKMRLAARLIVVSDLRRSAAGYAVAHAACRTLTRSRIVHCDGPRSVASAFTHVELCELFREAEMPNAVVRRTWPWRLLATHRSS